MLNGQMPLSPYVGLHSRLQLIFLQGAGTNLYCSYLWIPPQLVNEEPLSPPLAQRPNIDSGLTDFEIFEQHCLPELIGEDADRWVEAPWDETCYSNTF